MYIEGSNAIHWIQWISVNKTNHAIHWIVIYPVDSIGTVTYSYYKYNYGI